jgi:hypothetical protein
LYTGARVEKKVAYHKSNTNYYKTTTRTVFYQTYSKTTLTSLGKLLHVKEELFF